MVSQVRDRRAGAKKLRYSINHVRKIVESKGGKLLSQRYESRNTRVKVQCENGHKWEPTAGAILMEVGVLIAVRRPLSKGKTIRKPEMLYQAPKAIVCFWKKSKVLKRLLREMVGDS
jgi:hypothetical protein